MVIVRVQGNARGTTISGSTITVTMGSTPTNGNIIVACIGIAKGTPTGSTITVSSISQTNVTWTGSGNGVQASQTHLGTVSREDAEIWVGTVGSGPSATITVSLSASLSPGGGAIADVSEYSGLAAAASILNKTATNEGTGSNPSTGTTATTTQASELWIGSIFNFDSLGINDAAQSAPTNGFTLLDGANLNNTNSMSEGFLEKIVSATGTASTAVTVTDTTLNEWPACIATFKAAAAVVAGGQIIIFGPTGFE